jgi:hypothetical protein
MARILEIPIRFEFLKVPVKWELRTVRLGSSGPSVPMFCGQPAFAHETKLSKLDAWDCRSELFRLREGDTEGLGRFLEKVGVYVHDEVPGFAPREELWVYPEEVWDFRETLKSGLLPAYRRNVTAQLAPKLPIPSTILEATLRQHVVTLGEPPNAMTFLQGAPRIEFPLHFELADVAAGVITMTNARKMLLMSVFVDIVRGLRFKVCKRTDCNKQQIFPLESGHKREFCSQYCGHLWNLRRKRRKDSLQRKREARLAKQKRG